MKILVTGGAGFIGSHTVDALVATGNHQVSIIDNLAAGKRHQVNLAAKFHEIDLRDADAVRRAIEAETPEVIVHLAAQMDVRRSVADPSYDAQVNIIGFLNLIESARQRGLRRVIFSSTGGAIYGEQETFPASEDHPLHPVSPYGITKLATEAYLFFYKVQYGIDYAAMRYGNVHGPRQDPHGEAGVVAIFCGRILDRLPLTVFGDGRQTRDYVFVSDVARAALIAASATLPPVGRLDARAFNIGTGVAPPVLDIAEVLCRIADVRVPIEHAPARPGEQQRSAVLI